jgi:hypothetical protein
MQTFLGRGVRWVLICGKARGVLDADLAQVQAQWSTPKRFAELVAASDRRVSF